MERFYILFYILVFVKFSCF